MVDNDREQGNETSTAAEPEQPKKRRPDLVVYALLILLILIFIVFVLALVGPLIGNDFSSNLTI